MLIDKFLGFVLLRRTMSTSASLIESLLSGIAIIFTLGLMLNILLASLIVGGIYVSYNALLAHSLDPTHAGILVGIGIGIMLVIILLVLMLMIMRLRQLPKHFITAESAVTQTVNKVIDSFLEGFEESPPTDHPYEKRA